VQDNQGCEPYIARAYRLEETKYHKSEGRLLQRILEFWQHKFYQFHEAYQQLDRGEIY
jgi:hypothetical protein